LREAGHHDFAAGMPFFFSFELILPPGAATPECGLIFGPPPNWRMSYQARMRMPWLIVTGRTGACGNTKAHRLRELSSGTIGSKSCPSAPSRAAR